MLTAEAEYVLRTVEERGIRFVRLWLTDVKGSTIRITPPSDTRESDRRA
jgi:glutamine synthetase